jgi:hypothetical protein
MTHVWQILLRKTNILKKKKEEGLWQPQSEYFRISTIVSKYVLSPLVSFKVILRFELGLS